MITSVNNGQVKNIIQLNQKTKPAENKGFLLQKEEKCSAKHLGIGFRRCMYQKLSAVMQN